MRPTVGRIVHFVAPGEGTRAAIVTRVADDDVVDLAAFGRDALSFHHNVAPGKDTASGPCWLWPLPVSAAPGADKQHSDIAARAAIGQLYGATVFGDGCLAERDDVLEAAGLPYGVAPMVARPR